MSSSLVNTLQQKGSLVAVQALYKHLSPGVTKSNDVVVSRGEGSWVWTTDDRKLLDFSTGIGVTSTGHCHPRVVEAVRQQAGKIVHAQQNLFGGHEPMLALVDRLNAVMPPQLSRYFFCNSGSEAVDNAVKIARAATGRQNVIVFENSFHGRTMGAMALTTSKTIYRQGFGPLMPGVAVAPYPYCLHCKAAPRGGYQLQPDAPPFSDYAARACCDAPAEALEWVLKQQTAPSETAAVLLEPVMGEGGFLTPPASLTAAIKRVCDKHGILFIADEVQAGVGRTGKWWGHQHFPDMQPDILIFAKGIASGYPLAGVATTDKLQDKLPPGNMGGTYGGNAVACAAAVATLDAIQADKMLENAQQRGEQLVRGLLQLAKRFPIIDVRGRGLMIGVEFGGADGSKKPNPQTANSITRAAFRHGMLLLTAGARESIRLLPPLNVTEQECELALMLLEKSFADVFEQHAPVVEG